MNTALGASLDLTGSFAGTGPGAALSTGNFDGIGGDDLLIGVPGYGNAGRVHLILGMASLPDIVELADVGGAVPAAILISYSAAAD